MIPLLLAAAATATSPVLAVRIGTPVHAPGELAGGMICFIIGTRAEDALNAWSAASGVPIERLPFQEPDEMADALAVGKCAAAAIEPGELPDGARVLAVLATPSTLRSLPPSSRP